MSKHANRFDSTYRPLARTEDLVTTESNKEVLVYDERAHHIHHLNSTATTVYRLCDGTHAIDDIATIAALDDDVIQMALQQLQDADLLLTPMPTNTTQYRRPSRGEISRRGLLVAAIPAVISISAPRAAAADSSCVGHGETCGIDIVCCTGYFCMGGSQHGYGRCELE
jgi:hypothetical protein